MALERRKDKREGGRPERMEGRKEGWKEEREEGRQGGREEGRKGVCMHAVVCVTVKRSTRLWACWAGFLFHFLTISARHHGADCSKNK